MRAFGEFNALVFAANQEPNHSKIHQGDFDQIQNSVPAAIADRMLAIRSDSIRPISRNLVALPSQFFSIFNISCLLRGTQTVVRLAAIFETYSCGCSESSSVRHVSLKCLKGSLPFAACDSTCSAARLGCGYILMMVRMIFSASCRTCSEVLSQMRLAGRNRSTPHRCTKAPEESSWPIKWTIVGPRTFTLCA